MQGWTPRGHELGPDLLDELYMDRALQLAVRGWGRVHPNPLVGAVVVRDGAIVGEGWHAEYGGPHAEVAALRQAGEAARGATLYVTLEPCAHTGKTPPCTRAIEESGVVRVVYAAEDPNRKAAGGAARLERMGVEVVAGVGRAAARDQNRAFFHVHERGTAYATLKFGLSLDARIAAAAGRTTPITGPDARREVHRLRAGFDAIVVGSETARVDDPLLTVRHSAEPRLPPARVVIDTRARLAETSRLAATAAEAPVWVVCAEDAPLENVRRLEAGGVAVLRVARGRQGVDPDAALESLWDAGMRTLFCEGGARLGASLIEADRIERLYLFYAPLLLGEAGTAAFPGIAPSGERWRLSHVESHGSDVEMVLDRARTMPAAV